MLAIGLTGGMGSGKSTVAALFAELAITIIDCDVIARELVSADSVCWHQIIKHFGSSILLNEHELDRRQLRRIILYDTEARHWLENLLHPLIRQKIESAIKIADSAYCIVVIPLLAESAHTFPLQRVLVVDVDESLQKSRIQTRDQHNEQDIAAILQIQASRQDRLKIADDIIHNHGDLEDLRTQVEQLHYKYLSLV